MQRRIAEGSLAVLGASYDIDAGRVSFLDVPAELKQSGMASARGDAAAAT
jgi:hypothetical protein